MNNVNVKSINTHNNYNKEINTKNKYYEYILYIL